MLHLALRISTNVWHYCYARISNKSDVKELLVAWY